jgi:hypothetical protein
MAIYLPSLPSQVRTGDTAEYQTVPWILGIAHPTGFPAYTLVGWVVTHALQIGTVAWRMNAFAAFCTALTAAAVVLLAGALEAGSVAALAAGLAFGFGSVVWHGAAYASPHTLSGLCIVVVLAASVWFARHGDRRALIAASGFAGFGLATQPETIWVLPALAVACLWQRRSLNARTLLLCSTLVLASLLVYAYLPIRSAIVAATHQDPNAVAPLFGDGGIDWDEDHPRTLDGFLEEVLGRQAGAGKAVARSFDLSKVGTAGPFWMEHLREQFNDWLLLVAALGFVVLAVRDRRALSIVVAGTAGGLLFTYSYRLDVELYRYFLVTSATVAALAAASTRLALPRTRPAIAATTVSAVLVFLAAGAWVGNRGIIRETSYGGSQEVIDAVRHDIPDGAIVVASWYDATTLMYGVAVEHTLGSRLIVKGSPGEFVERYRDWAHSRRLFIYANRGVAPYVTSQVPEVWLQERPSTLIYYHVFEVIPTGI